MFLVPVPTPRDSAVQSSAWLRFTRYCAALFGSAAVTCGLLYMMVQLISSDDVPLVLAEPYDVVDIVRLLEDKEPEVKKQEVEPPPPVEKEPPPPTMLAQIDNTTVGVDIQPPVDQRPVLGKFPGITDGEQIPIVKVAPQYPNMARNRGIEGYVVLSFTITETGGIADAMVIEGQPRGVFDRSALNAVRKFKYKPKVVNGEPQPVHDVQHRLVYQLANG